MASNALIAPFSQVELALQVFNAQADAAVIRHVLVFATFNKDILALLILIVLQVVVVEEEYAMNHQVVCFLQILHVPITTHVKQTVAVMVNARIPEFVKQLNQHKIVEAVVG